MKSVSNWAICAVLLLGMGFIVLNGGFPTSSQAQSPSSRTSCSNATLKGTYVFGSTGYGGTTNTPFAGAALEVYGGGGTASGFATVTAAGQPVFQGTFTARYTVKSNCTVTETDTYYQNGVVVAVAHENEYTGPTGNKLTFILTDPNEVNAGFGNRVSEARSD
jgi:hypothetical protein